ncbi:hypothetical protein CEXT_798261 [Caerostris extrusa]|uniref:Secreted protein n=1 Tax=Caerostris extrusa TaxID=172846 RepID=A0AAV4UE92_CAEEX|nr:hypothetical protein CEXT_798261 [Caerostris extrusa]
MKQKCYQTDTIMPLFKMLFCFFGKIIIPSRASAVTPCIAIRCGYIPCAREPKLVVIEGGSSFYPTSTHLMPSGDQSSNSIDPARNGKVFRLSSLSPFLSVRSLRYGGLRFTLIKTRMNVIKREINGRRFSNFV